MSIQFMTAANSGVSIAANCRLHEGQSSAGSYIRYILNSIECKATANRSSVLVKVFENSACDTAFVKLGQRTRAEQMRVYFWGHMRDTTVVGSSEMKFVAKAGALPIYAPCLLYSLLMI